MTQLYTIIPYAFGIITLPIANIIADRLDKGLIGYIMLLTSTNSVVLMAGCCFVSAGAFPAAVLGSAWVMISHAGFTKQAAAWAISQIFIQCYSIISTQVYTDPPRFFKGHGTLLGLNALGTVAVLITMWLFKRENRRRDAVATEFAARGETNPESVKDYEVVRCASGFQVYSLKQGN
ncbi:major facilitator superfamily domain-containing protein [Penicillium alfredii]|uniref:Major facilitator superfamily domain-containing protein n=1 Tax=Penicillium alfredii TaxID=1506179 RepID=A0A9W9EGR5_9EURO|nr:major facilitator superfamily domain-containing protein [Penicillium alfredii]KAJ5081504.1 major facilitator superfamily domain-containing protein [Penicillium alfredii]